MGRVANLKVIGYIRESTDKQVLETDGLEIQRSRITNFCLKNKYNLIDIISDEGVSGAKEITDRPGILKLLELCKNSPISYVVVDKVDRFSRDMFHALFIKKELLRSNVRVLYSAQETLNESNMMTEMMEQIMMVFAEFERKMINKRTSDGMKKKAHGGNKAVGRQPFGYEWSPDKKQTVINEDQALVVRDIFNMRHQGKSLNNIADILNNHEYYQIHIDAYTGNNKNRKWTNQSVRWILTNDYYMGKVTHGGEKSEGKHKSIISANLWNSINQVN